MYQFALPYVLTLVVAFLLSAVLTPIMYFLSFQIGAVDYPNARRINTRPMPSAGGMAILVSFTLSSFVVLPVLTQATGFGLGYMHYIRPVIGAGWVIALTGLIDDIWELSPLPKVLGQVVAATIVWHFTVFRLDHFKVPFGGPLLYFPSWFSFLLTVIWILAITNAINLIDGLDGLVGGVSIISLLTMGLVATFFIPGQTAYLPIAIFILVWAIIGFMPYNINPAIIYLGDSGSMFIGFMIAVLSLQGLKYATAVAVVSPILILGVPITDTVLAIVRRTISGKKFYEADKMHLHHRLLSLGLTHRGAVYVIYAISFMFAIVAFLFNLSSRLGGILLIVALVFGVEILSELIGILGENRTPILNIFRFIGNSSYREAVMTKMGYQPPKHKHQKRRRRRRRR